MFKLIKRYFAGFVLTSILWIIAFSTTVILFEGFIPVLVGILTISWIIGYIPYCAKMDYNKIRDHLIKAKMVKNGEMTKKEFGVESLKLISEETGVPEFIVDTVIKKINKKS